MYISREGDMIAKKLPNITADIRYQGSENLSIRISAVEPRVNEFAKSLPPHIRPCASNNQLDLAGFDDVWDDGPPWVDWPDVDNY